MTDAITYDDVLLVPSYNHWESRRIVDISMTDKTGKLSLQLPVMTANMDTVTETAMADFIGQKGGIGVLHRFMSIEDNIAMFKACNFNVFVSIGCTAEDMQRTEALRDAGADLFCIDVAHAHARYVGKTLKKVRAMLGKQALRDVSVTDLWTLEGKLAEEDFQKALYAIEEIERTQKAAQALLEGDLKTLGALIYQSHHGLSKQYKVSCEELDFLVDLTKKEQAVLGARMMGGGFGGCTINLIHTDKVEEFIDNAKAAYQEKFDLDLTPITVKISNGVSKIESDAR
jgi:hypothetical protein